LKVRHAAVDCIAVGLRVEAVAVGGDAGSGPGRALQAPVGDEDGVAGVGGGEAVESA
jgi:hypothetical protein